MNVVDWAGLAAVIAAVGSAIASVVSVLVHRQVTEIQKVQNGKNKNQDSSDIRSA